MTDRKWSVFSILICEIFDLRHITARLDRIFNRHGNRAILGIKKGGY